MDTKFSCEWIRAVSVVLEHDAEITISSLCLQSCLVVFFHDGGSHDRASEFIQEMKQKHVSK